MRASGLLAREGRVSDRPGNLEAEGELQRAGQLCVEGAARVLDLDPLEPIPKRAKLPRQCLEAFFGPEHAGARIHVVLHLLPDGSDSLLASLLLQERCLNAPGLIREKGVA